MITEQGTRHAIFAEGAKTRYSNDLAEALAEIEERILGKVSGYNISSWTRARAEKQIAELRSFVLGRYNSDIVELLNSQIDEFAKYEAEFEKKSLTKADKERSYVLPTLAAIFLAVRERPLTVEGQDAGKLVGPYIKENITRHADGVANSVRLGFAQGEKRTAVVSRLKSEVLPANARGLDLLARTTLQHAAIQAKNETYFANEQVRKIRIVAVLDSRTSAICRSMDGKEFPVDEGPRPPFHKNCRTTIIPVTREPGGRRELDPVTGDVGTVPAETTYYSWLKTQPSIVQDEIIGPNRGKLLRDGGLSSQRFSELGLTKNFKPRTIEEMRKIEPLAFIKADI